MAWHLLEGEEGHPAYRPELAEKWRDMILWSYQQADEIVGQVQKIIGNDAILIVNSDHGFNSFRRAVNINTWLQQNGFLSLIGQNEAKNLEDLFGQGQFWQNVDWSKTKAYALGLGQIYINLDGRESQGIVADGTEKKAIMDAIRTGLLNLRDPEFSLPDYPVILGAYYGHEIYSGPQSTMSQAPDIVVGFNNGYRTSWQTALGGVPPDIFENNARKWSGDHCSFDPSITIGVLFSSIPIKSPNPRIIDILPSALTLLGIAPGAEVDGKNIF
jgi:predicted AlkP superfamily phosphohydrolase/phosphomutase